MYRWYHDGNLIDGASTATYAISSMNSTQAGIYAVGVSMPDGHMIRSPDFRVSLAEITQPGTGTGTPPTTPTTGGQTGTGGSSSGGSGSSGGGGATGPWFIAALALLGALSQKRSRRR